MWRAQAGNIGSSLDLELLEDRDGGGAAVMAANDLRKTHDGRNFMFGTFRNRREGRHQQGTTGQDRWPETEGWISDGADFGALQRPWGGYAG